MNMRSMSCFALSLVCVVPSLFGKENFIDLYNNTIYPVNAEITFNCETKWKKLCQQRSSLPAGTSAQFEIPFENKGSRDFPRLENYSLVSIKVTVPSEVKSSPIWQDGKVGGTIVGSKSIVRQAQSVVFNTDGRSADSGSFVINANRTPGFTPDLSAFGGSGPIERVQNLAVYRFIQ